MADDKKKPAAAPKAAAKPAGPAPAAPSAPAAGPADEAKPAGTDQQGRQLYSVKCAECGKQTEVPFKPFGDRPVYCRECYLQKKGAGR